MLALAGAIAPMWAQAADFPSKPVRVVVPYSPGGPADALMRAVGQKLSDKWGQPVIVENRPGANEIIGADTVIKAAPDGYTLLLGSEAAFSLNPQLYAKLSYKPADLAPVSRLVTAQLMLVTRPDFPADDVAGLIKHLKANPGKYTYGITGIGGVLHLAGAWFNQLYGVQTSEVPYKGLPLAMQDVMAGRVDMLFAIAGGPMPHVATGKLKATALAGPHRVAIAPDVPTFAQAGYPEFDASVYFALAAPAGTPEDAPQGGRRRGRGGQQRRLRGSQPDRHRLRTGARNPAGVRRLPRAGPRRRGPTRAGGRRQAGPTLIFPTQGLSP